MERGNEEPGGERDVISGRILEEAGVELAIRIVLMFFFIQFLVVMTMMSIVLLRTHPEVPICGLGQSHRGLNHSLPSMVALPGRGLRSIVRTAKSIRLRDKH